MTSTASAWNASSAGGRAAPGTVVGGRYALRAAIGTGGMGTVWRASDTLLRREVAVKEVVCPPGLAPTDRDSMYERTLREGRAAAALSHPSIVQVYDVVTDGGRPWIVMELLDARSLADMVLEDGPLAPRAVAKIGIALLGALEVAHAGGVLHRDVKPANVLICADGRCVLTDFGVARMPTDVQLTTPGMVLGSPHFISPERAMGGAFGPPSDLFSLGVTLYTAVEGRPPFDRGDPIETMHAVVEEPPATPIRAGTLAGVLYGLLEKDPNRRWDVSSARSVLRDLIAGPLASRARDHVTDPYAVVPSQRTSWPAVAPPPAPSGQIGGRAMLSPDVPLDELIAQMHTPVAEPEPRAFAGTAPELDQTDPTGAIPPQDAMWRASHRPPAAQTGGAQRALRAGAEALAGTKRAGAEAVAAVRRWPRGTRLAVTAGVCAALLVGTLAVAGNWFGDRPAAPVAGPSQAQETPTAAPTTGAPLIDVQVFNERGLVVNVPQGWKRVEAGTYVDFVDPADDQSRVRINVTDEKDSRRALESAERTFTKSNGTCAPQYERIGLTDELLAGNPATQLEYLCTPKDRPQRHGIWRIAVVNGKAYHVYLVVPAAKFAERKVIFEEMIRSFQLAS